MKPIHRSQQGKERAEPVPVAEPAAESTANTAEPAVASTPVAVPGLNSRRTSATTAAPADEPAGSRIIAVLRARANAVPTAPASPDLVRAALGSPGKPLDEPTRSFMEPRIGADLSGVRIHTGAVAAESAQAVAARAYTVGQDIVFGDAEYQPSSSSGRHLLAHELVHTVQNRSSTIARSASGDLQVSEPTDPLEQAAEARAAEVMSGAPPAVEQPLAEPAEDGRTGGRLSRALHTDQFRTFAAQQAPGVGGPRPRRSTWLPCSTTTTTSDGR